MGILLIALLGAVAALVAVWRTEELRHDREAERLWVIDDEPFWAALQGVGVGRGEDG